MASIPQINIGGTTYNLKDSGAVRYDSTQSLTTAQKTTARGNIDASSTEEVSSLKSALTRTMNDNKLQYVNLIGQGTEYYPVDIPVGTKVTMSTADGTAYGSGGLDLNYYDENKTFLNNWNFSQSSSKRTVTLTDPSSLSAGNIKYFKWTTTPTKLVQVEIGETNTPYNPYYKPLDSEAMRTDIDGINSKIGSTTLPTTSQTLTGAIAEHETDISNLNDDTDSLWKTSTEKTITIQSNSYTGKFNVYASDEHLIIITTSVNNSGIRAIFYFEDGTSVDSVRLYTEFRYRPKKKLKSINIYNGASSEVTFTITKTYSPLQVTNYYDKTAKISGYINNGSVSSGYYHSDYIPVEIGDKIIAPGYPGTFGNTIRFHFYNKDKTYLGRATASAREDGLYQINTDLSSIGSSFSYANIAYFNFNMSVAGSDTAVCYINTEPDTKLGYGQVQPDSALFFNKQQIDFISTAGLSPLSGKKIAYNGDSIAESRLSAGNTYNGGAYPKIIADLTNGTYSNRAHGGGILASAAGDSGSTPARLVVSDVTNMPDDADLICFEGGINDYWRDVPLGDYTESDYSSTLDTTTLCGALESIFRQATEKWIGKPIVFVIVHKIKSTVYAANSAGWTFAQGREKMIGICNKYAIPYYDAFAESGLNAYNNIQNSTYLTSNSSGTADGCHPNEAAYKRYYVPQLIALFESLMPRSV